MPLFRFIFHKTKLVYFLQQTAWGGMSWNLRHVTWQAGQWRQNPDEKRLSSSLSIHRAMTSCRRRRAKHTKICLQCRMGTILQEFREIFVCGKKIHITKKKRRMRIKSRGGEERRGDERMGHLIMRVTQGRFWWEKGSVRKDNYKALLVPCDIDEGKDKCGATTPDSGN